MMIDLNRILKSAIKSGKIHFGSKRTVDAARSGKVIIIITSSNCHDRNQSDIQYHADLSEIPVYEYEGSSLELGIACGKNFPISALAIREINQPELIRMIEEQSSEIE